MPLREILSFPRGLAYNSAAGPDQPAQVALRDGRAEVGSMLPPGYMVRVSGANRNLPRVPWLAVLDKDVTTTAQEGFYLVYLFSADLERVYLSMNQGVTAHQLRFRTLGQRGAPRLAREELRRESSLLREDLAGQVDDLDATVDLGDDGDLARGYEAGNVVARTYESDGLPGEEILTDDLERFLGIYRQVIEGRDRLLTERPGTLHVPTRSRTNPQRRATTEQAPIFRPKDAGDYVANVPTHQQRKTRKHEDLVKRFGTYAREHDWRPATNVHPRDLVLRRDGTEVLVEAKTVGNNAEFAVREAIGQLFTYRYFLYTLIGDRDPTLLALFSEPIGEAFVELLAGLGIEAAWFDDGTWTGSTELGGLLQVTAAV